MVAPSVCIENYGYNSIKLNAPSQETKVTVRFRGKAGESGYRALNVAKGGWKYGFVALLRNGTSVYSNAGAARVTNGINPDQTLSFICPANCIKLWLVVSGAPQDHWKHAWDDNNSNDEQWPYQVQFDNTDLLGVFSTPIHDETLAYNLTVDPRTDYTATPVSLNSSRISKAFAMSPENIAKALGSTITYYGINPDNSLNLSSTANPPGHWFSGSGQTTAWGTNAFLYSELNLNSLVANIGQYPGKCVPGQTYTIKQALIYKKSQTESAKLTLIFHVTIKSITTGLDLAKKDNSVSISPNPSNKTFSAILPAISDVDVFTADGKLQLSFKNITTLEFGEELNPGIYIVRTGNFFYKIIKE